MTDTELTYAALRNELTRRVFQYTFTGPLLLLWSLGLVTFMAVFERPLFALIWSTAILILICLTAAEALRTPKVRERLIRSIVRKRLGARELVDDSSKSVVDEGIDAFTEITLKIYQFEKHKDSEARLRRLIPLTHRMVTLLRDSAREVEELERGLNLAKGSTPETEVLPAGQPEGIHSRRQESIENVRREVEQARVSVNDIGRQLQTLMLKVFQVERVAGDPMRNSELVREAEELLARLARQIEPRRAGLYGSAEVQQTRAALEAGFSEINSSDGLSALQQLVYEYAQLRPLLDRKQTSDVGFVRISSSVEETYRLGLSLLHDTLEIMRTVLPSESRRLEAEILQVKGKIEAASTDESQQERVIFMQATLNSHLERLEIMQKQRLRIDQLLRLCGRCEASLTRTRVELAALKAGESELSVNDATDRLRRTIEQAKEVQEELQKLGF